MRTDVQHDHGCPEHAWIHYHVSPYVAVTGHGDILDVGCLLACRSLSLIYDHFSYRNVVDPAIICYYMTESAAKTYAYYGTTVSPPPKMSIACSIIILKRHV